MDGKVCIDFFIRFEAINEGVEYVCHTLGIPFEPERLPKLKSGLRKDSHSLAEYYDPTTLDLVKRRYALEIEKFGYDLGED